MDAQLPALLENYDGLTDRSTGRPTQRTDRVSHRGGTLTLTTTVRKSNKINYNSLIVYW